MADPNKIKIGTDLLAEFSECFGTGRKARVEFTEEQQALLINMYAKRECNRKAFVRLFKNKYGFGSRDLFFLFLRENNIKIESRIKEEAKQ